MACKIERNAQGQVETVYQEDGRESLLFKDINVNAISNSETALLAYLEIADNLKSRRITEESVNLDSRIVQKTIDKVKLDPESWDRTSKELKEGVLKSKVGDSLEYLFEKLGIDIKVVSEIKDVNGNSLDQIAAADIANRVIELTKDNTNLDIISEEAAHFIVEVLRAQGHPLYESMARAARGTQLYKELMDPNSVHYELYNGNEDLIAREVMGKLISKEIVKGEQTETKTFNSRLQRWFDKVLNYLNKLFGRAHSDPFVKTAHAVLNKELDLYFNDMSSSITLEGNKFFNEGTRQENILNKLTEESALYETQEIRLEDITQPSLKKYFTKLVDEDGVIERYVGKKGTIYADKILKKRSSDVGSLKYQNTNKYRTPEEEKIIKDMQNIRLNTGTKGHLVMEELIKKYTGVSNKRFNEILSESGPMFTVEQFETLKKGVQFVVKEITKVQEDINKKSGKKGKFKLIAEQFISNEREDIGGTIDVLVVYSDGTASIYDWKFKSPAIGRNAISTKKGVKITGDMYASSLEGYDSQIGQYKEALLTKYGVTKIRHSRIVPISVIFKRTDNNIMTDEISQLNMWTGAESDNTFLEHIPVANEMTEDESINKLIRKEMNRFNLLARQYGNAPHAEKKELEERMASSRLIIKRLQLDQEISAGIIESFKILKKVHSGIGVEEEYIVDENGEEVINPAYLDDRELREAYEELQHFLAFASLPGVRDTLKEQDTTESKTLLKEMSRAAFEISTTLEQMSLHMVERVDKSAREMGINNIKYNRKGTLEAWIPSSAHKSPYSRYIHQKLHGVKVQMIRKEKELAQEIYEHEQELFEWGESNGYSNTEVFDLLINPDTHNLHPKYKTELYDLRKKAIKDGKVSWLKENYSVDMKYYTDSYNNWERRAFKNINNLDISNQAKDAKKLQWKKEYDVLQYDSAWLGNGGKYFTKLNEEKASIYLTDSYRNIQNNLPLKNFYDFHVKKIHEFEKMFGMKLGPTFIANVKKSLIDSVLESGNKIQALSESAYDMLHVTDSNMTLGSTDLEGNFMREIPKLYTRELRDSNNEVDRSLRSRELGRSLYLLGRSAMEYEFLNDIKDDLLLLELILNEGMIGEVQEDLQGNTFKESIDGVRKVFGNKQQDSSDLFSDMINEGLYGRRMKTQDKVTDSGFSFVRAGLGAKTFSSIAALGLKVPVALGAFGAGVIGLHIQAAKAIHYNASQLREAEMAILRRDPKVRAIVEHFEIVHIDMSKRRGDNLASNWKSKYLTQDRWFEFLAQADKLVDSTLAVAMAKNHAIDESGNLKRLNQLPEGTMSLYDSIEITENTKWKKNAPIDKYKVNVPGGTDRSFESFRGRVHEMSNSVKGTASPDSMTTAKQHLINRFFMHYRSWLPGIALERFGKTRYSHILESFNEGTWLSAYGNFGPEEMFNDAGQMLDVEIGTHLFVQEIATDIIKIGIDVATFGTFKQAQIKEKKARYAFEQFLQDNLGNEEYNYKTEQEKEEGFQNFLEMKQGNLRAVITEVRSVLLLLLMVSLAGGDYDDDNKVDIRQTWAGRKMHNVMNRIYRETAIFLDPGELTGPRASGIPLLTLGKDLTNLVSNSLDEIRDIAVGEDSNRDSQPPGYNLLKFAPGINGVAKALEIYPQYKYART